HRAPAVQAGRTVHPVRERPADLRGPAPDPTGLGMVVPLGHQEDNRGGLPCPPRPARHVTRSTNTPGTRPLLPNKTSCPGNSRHRAVAAEPEPPSWLAWAVCAGTRSYGPEGAPAQQCVGATWLEALELAQGVQQMGLVPDQRPVQQLVSAALDPPFHYRVPPGHPDTAQHGGDPQVGQYRVEQRRELAVPVADQVLRPG